MEERNRNWCPTYLRPRLQLIEWNLLSMWANGCRRPTLFAGQIRPSWKAIKVCAPTELLHFRWYSTSDVSAVPGLRFWTEKLQPQLHCEEVPTLQSRFLDQWPQYRVKNNFCPAKKKTKDQQIFSLIILDSSPVKILSTRHLGANFSWARRPQRGKSLAGPFCF